MLMVPTFLGTTFLVFVILQVAPDGPFERAVRQLKEANMGSEGGGARSIVSSQTLTPELLNKLRMQYGLDKPIVIRYLIWLGVYPKEIKNKTLIINDSFRDSFTSIDIGEFKKYLLQKYVKVVKEEEQ